MATRTPVDRPSILVALPLLHVSSTLAAEAFYCGRLGFAKESEDRAPGAAADPAFLCVVRDGVRIHLSSHAGDGAAGGVVGLWVRGVDALFAEFRSRGVPVALEPTDQTWGNREMYVRDPDGNTLRFMQAAKR